MKYHYEIEPRPAELGGGWNVRLMDGDQEVGGGVFPVRQADQAEAVTWWEGLREAEQAWWIQNYTHTHGGLGTAELAFAASLRLEAYEQAQAFADEWLERQD